MASWLVKSEPSCFSIADLAAAPDQTTSWTGVRNYQARNYLRQMQPGDAVLYYHSTTDPGLVGLARVVRESHPDPTAWDPEDSHFDPRSTPEKPLWDTVDLRWEATFPRPLPLALLRRTPGLEGLELLRKGSRLSVMPVSEAIFARIMETAMEMARELAGETPARG